MELRHLRYFVASAQELNFQRAAERLHVSTSAVSRLIVGMERELDVTLFERLSRGVRLTAAGQSLFNDARKLLEDFEQSCKRAQSIARGEQGVLRICFSKNSASHPAIREAIRQFHKAMPQIEIELTEMTTAEQLGGLMLGKFDVAFTYVGNMDTQVFEYREIQREEMVLALPIDHPLAKRRRVLLADLKNENFVMPRDAPRLCSMFIKACEEAGFSPRIVQQFARHSALFHAVSAGIGVSFAYAAQAAAKLPTVVFKKVFDLNEKFYLDLIWKKGDRSESLMKFVGLVLAQPVES